jgi:hypothetical protein
MEKAIRKLMGNNLPPRFKFKDSYDSIEVPTEYQQHLPTQEQLETEFDEMIAEEAELPTIDAVSQDLQVISTNVYSNTATGMFGIGTANPDYTLHVDGDAGITSNLTVGTANLFVDTTTGRVGINTTTPGYDLDVNGDINFTGTFYQGDSPFVSSLWTAGSDSLYYRSNVEVGTANLFVDTTTGNVGVGTDTPAYTLDVYGTAKTGALTATTGAFSGDLTLNLTDNAPAIRFDSSQNIIRKTSGWESYFTARETSIERYADKQVYASGSGAILDTTHRINFGYSDTYIDNGGYYPTHHEMHFDVMNGTSDNNATLARIMTLRGDGNVGVGTASPEGSLHVQGNRSIFGNNGGASDIVINDAPTARWKIATGGYGLSFSKHSSASDEYSTWSEKVRIDQNGRVGIGLTNPSSPLHVSASTTSTDTMRITHTDTNATSATRALVIDANYSGSDTFTGDKANAGLYIDLDSSATGGDLNEEHRIYGIYSDTRHSGDSDLVSGIYSYVKSDHTSGTTTNLKAGDFLVVSSGAGINTNIYGISSLALKDGGSTGATSKMYGVRGEVEVDAGTCTNAYAFQSHIDRDGGTIGTGYLYYGSYAGTVGTKWGIYLAGETKNYFSGDVGIGTNNPQAPLHVNATSAMIIPYGTTAQQPTGQTGMLRFNTTLSRLQLYDGTKWKFIEGMYASGGDVKTSRYGYYVHAFKTSGTFTVYSGGYIDVLVVGGGGGGGADNGGGGGAGGLIFRPGLLVGTGSYTINVGAGGTGAAAQGITATKGGNTTAFGLTALGGGYGNNGNNGDGTANSGGSGGGGDGERGSSGGSGTQPSQSGDSGTYGYGNAGGNTNNSDGGGGGGGGAGAAGTNGGSNQGGFGGDGLYEVTVNGVVYDFAYMFGNSLGGQKAGSVVYFAGGGAGGNKNQVSTNIDGGRGGGGKTIYYEPWDGSPNTGGGGGGSTYTGSVVPAGGNGGSGVVLIRYLG